VHDPVVPVLDELDELLELELELELECELVELELELELELVVPAVVPPVVVLPDEHEVGGATQWLVEVLHQ
jgi:hypothetical protein